MSSLTSHQRICRALAFEEPDRVPRFYSFWSEFSEVWKVARKEAAQDSDAARHYGSDMMVVAANESAWPSAATVIEQHGDETIQTNGWGVTARSRSGAMFSKSLETSVPSRIDPDKLVFEDPLSDSRYQGAGRHASKHREELAVFCKTGGPYLRAAFMRGQEDFLMDIAEDPEWVRAFVERVTEHITQVGIESIRRFGLQETGIGIYDDVCTMTDPIMGASNYEKLFYPSLCRMVDGYKQAEATTVFHHCDGKVDDLLDMWSSSGITAVHPLEARVCMHPSEVKRRFGKRLAVIGGLDNCNLLPRGDIKEIHAHLDSLLDAAAGGGMVISPHSIGEDISVETMDAVTEYLNEHDSYPAS
ncbi:MAG: uroporphyrinogen decarboxylase family protein [Planctomycetota bacterium]|nr:uroporphyrinogen decarboxylase family protein [Planctomycetota bacterium]MDP7251750.1 uroporphyrinogen decarboxylase family protein [Planctomycetota bacterium]